MELYVVRHGTTDWNAQCRFQGRVDIDLNAKGRELAGNLGRKLENVRFDRIYSSPLNRAYETAALIRGHKNIRIEKNDLLTEIGFGEAEGVFYDDWMKTDLPRKYFFSEPLKYIPPNGGETLEEICARTKKFVRTEIEPKYEKNPDGRYMIVAHGALIASMICYLENHGIENFWGSGLKGNCEEAIYEFDGRFWKNISPARQNSENPYEKKYDETRCEAK